MEACTPVDRWGPRTEGPGVRKKSQTARDDICDVHSWDELGRDEMCDETTWDEMVATKSVTFTKWDELANRASGPTTKIATKQT